MPAIVAPCPAGRHAGRVQPDVAFRYDAIAVAARRRGLMNVRAIAADARCVLARLIPDASVAAYHLYFPDPWPKTRHRQRRLVTQMYFDDTDAKVFAQDKLLQHDLWGNTNPLPSAIFAKLQKERSTLDATAMHYRFDIVL